jgi:hypothetical protein
MRSLPQVLRALLGEIGEHYHDARAHHKRRRSRNIVIRIGTVELQVQRSRDDESPNMLVLKVWYISRWFGGIKPLRDGFALGFDKEKAGVFCG